MRTTFPTAVLGAALLLCSCSVVEETGRRQFAPLPESMMVSLGAQSYAEATAPYREIKGTPEAAMVQRVGRRIAAASGRNYDWEFKLLDAPNTANAFALPGGKVAVYSGILPITRTEGGLAAVLGHEVAHATSHHGNERMSQGLLLQVGLAGIEAALANWSKTSPETRADIMAALGLGARIGVELPYSRKHEEEADEIGTRFMIRAGYDPYEAVALWERMAAASSSTTPELLSTHPLPAKRAERLRRLIPKLMAEETGPPESTGR